MREISMTMVDLNLSLCSIKILRWFFRVLFYLPVKFHIRDLKESRKKNVQNVSKSEKNVFFYVVSKNTNNV